MIGLVQLQGIPVLAISFRYHVQYRDDQETEFDPGAVDQAAKAASSLVNSSTLNRCQLLQTPQQVMRSPSE